ncbi:HNH endonuclease [Streptomyces albidoflavus]|uniref:HNH endonuclease n=1 Tax=Streptomyces albidoflavus TaxID=1886 RepID=UPI0010200C72|nr:HNH endonuclease signature motif containing protein [Streptomyces albidoflavus]
MWQVDRPKYTAGNSFRVCISRIQDPELKKRLRKAETFVITAAASYAASAESVTLHSLEQGDFIPDGVTKEELTSVYTSRMAKKKAVGRHIYDELILAAEDGRCPLCGQRPVSTLDHHLPKTLYPALVVDPLNLVPACADCNKLKRDVAPHSSEEETIHPYFDKIECDPWLRADVIDVAPAAVRFSVSPPENWSSTLTKRVRHHFKTFGLASLYASQAAQEVGNIRYYLTQLYEADTTQGAQRVSDHLREQAESRRQAHINSWQTATYSALADSSWFCQGGFA